MFVKPMRSYQAEYNADIMMMRYKSSDDVTLEVILHFLFFFCQESQNMAFLCAHLGLDSGLYFYHGQRLRRLRLGRGVR